MRFYTKPPTFYWGLDLHARTMYLCILNQEGEVFLHRTMKAAPEPFLQAMAPSWEAMVVCVEGLFTGSWLADLCAPEGIPFVLGHALDMKAIPGGKAQHDTSDAPNIAALRRGGLMPQADGSPAEMRATRDLLRRRLSLPRPRAALLTPVQHTNGPYPVPALGPKIASQAHRVGVAARCPEPAVQKSLEVDRALIAADGQRLRALEWALVTTAKPPDATTLSVLHTVPGIGQRRRLVRLSARQDSTRFPRGQALVSSCRVVTCAKAAAGKRDGTSGTQSGHASRTGACSEAAALCLRHTPAGQKSLARFEKQHGQGKALTALAPQLARAVYALLKRGTAGDMDPFRRGSGSGAGAPMAELGHQGSACPQCSARSHRLRRRTRRRTSALSPDPAPLSGRLLPLLDTRRAVRLVSCGLPLPRTWT